MSGSIHRWSIIEVVAIMGVVLVTTAGASANDEEDHGPSWSRRVMTVPSNMVVHADYFAFGDTVTVSGTVEGDAYIFARQVLIDGTIEGDLLASAATMSLSGRIGQDARLAGGQITVTGGVGQNLTLAGGNVEISGPATVNGNVVAAGGNFVVAAPIKGDAKIAAGNLTVSNEIDGNLHVASGGLRLTSNATVNGNLTVWGDEAPFIDAQAQIKGAIIHKAAPELSLPGEKQVLAALAGIFIVVKVVSFLSSLILGLLLIYLFPRYTDASVDALRLNPWASLGIGFAGVILAPVGILLLMATLVGFPLAMILSALYLITLYLGRIFVIFWAGRALLGFLQRVPREGWALVVGLMAYYLVTLIPLIGWLVSLFVLLFGLGASLLAQKKTYADARQGRLI